MREERDSERERERERESKEERDEDRETKKFSAFFKKRITEKSTLRR